MKMLLMMLMASLPFYFVESKAKEFNSATDLCENNLALKDVYHITVDIRRKGSKKWKTSFSVKNLGNTSTEPIFDIKHEMDDCGGLVLHRIKGLMKGGHKTKLASNNQHPPIKEKFSALAFHDRTGKNIAVRENGSMALKMRKYYGIALTKRTLQDGEILKMRINAHKLNSFGVTTFSPDNITYPPFMESLESGIWGYNVFQKEIFHNCTVIKTNYGISSNYIKEGDVWGVTRKPGGALHFFHNGKDLGPAAINVPDKVYGYVEIFGSGAAVIVNKKNRDPEDFVLDKPLQRVRPTRVRTRAYNNVKTLTKASAHKTE